MYTGTTAVTRAVDRTTGARRFVPGPATGVDSSREQRGGRRPGFNRFPKRVSRGARRILVGESRPTAKTHRHRVRKYTYFIYISSGASATINPIVPPYTRYHKTQAAVARITYARSFGILPDDRTRVHGRTRELPESIYRETRPRVRIARLGRRPRQTGFRTGRDHVGVVSSAHERVADAVATSRVLITTRDTAPPRIAVIVSVRQPGAASTPYKYVCVHAAVRTYCRVGL